MYFKRPNLSRQEVQVDGQTVINAFDGTTPWIINPLTGFNRPVTVSGAQADSIREDSSFDGPLVDYKSRGMLIDYVGREPLGEGEAHHLRVTSASRQVRHLYLDATDLSGGEAGRRGGADASSSSTPRTIGMSTVSRSPII